MSLRDGTKKMSKSDASDYSRINMTDDADTIRQKVRKAKTEPDADAGDCPRNWRRARGRPILLGIYAALADKALEATVTEFAGAPFSRFKEALSDLAVSVLGKIGGEMRRLLADPA